jgi:DNA-binding SARP family transcriptional activator/DNA-binding beta-propeller fold protein YncE
VDFRILGPLEARQNGDPLPLGGAKQRALLALLILRRDEVVTSERLIHELWGECPPASALKTVQVYVSQLRKALGTGQLTTHGHGYKLSLEPSQLDLDRFEALTEGARRLFDGGDPRGAAETLREALALWRGPPLADFAYEPFAQSEIARLEELRLSAIEERIDADLAMGRHAELVPELDGLAREHPVRERLRGQLMLALYHSGRQADALQAYQDARRLLDADVGLEPGRGLKELERGILAQDPALDAPPRGRAEPPALRPARKGRVLLGVGCVLLAAALAIAVAKIAGHDDVRTTASLEPGSVGLVDPSTGHLRVGIRVPGEPARLATAGETVWVGADRSRTISTINGRNIVSQVGSSGGHPTDLAIGEGGVWVVDGIAGTLTQFSPAYSEVVRRIRIRGAFVDAFGADRSDAFAPWSVAAGERGVWVTDGSPRLRLIDARRGKLAATLDLHRRLNGVAVGAGGVWAISGRGSTVLRLDPRTRRMTDRIQIVSRAGFESPYPVAIEVGAGSVWVLNANTQTVTRIDPRARGITATIPIGVERGPLRLAAGDGAAWVANDDGTLSRIDAATNAVRTFAVAPGLRDVGVVPGGIWVTAGPGSSGRASADIVTGSRASTRAIGTATCSPIY